MGTNLYIANTATLILIGLQLMVPSYVGAVENAPLSTMTSMVEHTENSDNGDYEPPNNAGPGSSVGGGSR